MTTQLTDPRTRDVRTAYLATSPEYNHKKLLGAGIYNTVEITRSFRDGESWGDAHNPEFTILEWYRTPADYRMLMDDCEQLIRHVQSSVIASPQGEAISQQRAVILSEAKNPVLPETTGSFGVRPQDDASRQIAAVAPQPRNDNEPWPRRTISDLFKQYCDADITDYADADWRSLAQRLDITHRDEDTLSDLFYRIFLNRIEPEITKQGTPLFVYDYPMFQGALARRKKDDPRVAERFELFAGGLELANAYSELLDATEQRERLEAQRAYREQNGLPRAPIDEAFLKALEADIPETAGCALGVDRLVMWLLGKQKIEDVLALPANELF